MFSRLLNIGITDQLDYYQKRETKVLNLFSFITLAGLIAGTVNIYFLGEIYPTLTVILETIANGLILFLNYKKLHQAAAILFVLSINILLLYLNIYYDQATGTYLYYFPLIFCIALLHNPNKAKIRDLIFFGVIVLSFFGSRFLHLPSSAIANVSDEQTKVIFSFNINLVAILTIILVYLVINLINKQYRELTDLLKKTQDDQVTIQNSLNEKEVLLAEVQHRVKNNLSVIIGLFNLQRDNAINEETKLAIGEAKNRVLSIAMVHERLYKKEDLSHINLKYYISELAKEIVRSHPLYNKIIIVEELEDIVANITKAVPIGLVVNEIITNSLKHAFKDSANPSIKIILTTHFGLISVKITDNGKGFSENKERNERSLGLNLIEALAEQIDGNIFYSSNGGASVKLSFPI